MTPSKEGPWPNLFLVGAAKAASTSLYRYLDQHPEIEMVPGKAPDYFGRIGTDDEMPLDEYLALFEGTGDVPIRGDASMTYLNDPPVAERIHDEVPDARILVILREPIERSYSQYWSRRSGGAESRPFHEAVRLELEGKAPTDRPAHAGYVARSLYFEDVQRFVDRFGRDQVHVCLTAHLADDPRRVLRGIAEFLDVDVEAVDAIDAQTRHNPSAGVPYGGVVEKIRTSETLGSVARTVLPGSVRDWIGNDLLLRDEPRPPVEPRTKRMLQEVFEPDLRKLEELLDRELPELREGWVDPADAT